MFFAPVSADPSIQWAALGQVTVERDYKPFAEVNDIAQTLKSAIGDKEFIVDGHFSAADVRVGTTVMWGTQLMPVYLPYLNFWPIGPGWNSDLPGGVHLVSIRPLWLVMIHEVIETAV